MAVLYDPVQADGDRHLDDPHIFPDAMKLTLASENVEYKELVA